MNRRDLLWAAIVLSAGTAFLMAFWNRPRSHSVPTPEKAIKSPARPVQMARPRTPPRGTVADRLRQYRPAARSRWRPHFRAAGVTYPPRHVVLVGFKHEKRLEVYAGPAADAVRFIRAYPILAASGTVGPKRREGDGQVPEGLYGIDFLNPNSRFHLSMRISYPNAFDRAQARREGRTDLGGDIMIHGGAASIGCLAMGDKAAEDLFILAADVGRRHITVILSPVDFRVRYLPADRPPLPSWTRSLYDRVRAALDRLPTRPAI